MGQTNRTLIINRLMVLMSLSSSIICISPDAPYWFYGLFSMSSCQSRFTFSCSNAISNHHMMTKTIKLNNYILKTKMDFCARDVGDKEPDLINAITPILLSNRDINTTDHCIDETITGIHKREALFIYAHITFELTQLASALLIPFEIPLLATTYQQMYPDLYLTHPFYIFSYDGSFGRDVHVTGFRNIIQDLNITVIATLHLVENEHQKVERNLTACQDDDQGAFCTYIGFKIKDSCLKERFLNINDDQELNTTLEFLLEMPRFSFILVQGSSTLMAKFDIKIDRLRLQDHRLVNKIFLSFETTEKHQHNTSIELRSRYFGHEYASVNSFYNLEGSIGMNTLFHYLHHMEGHFLTPNFFHEFGMYWTTEEIKQFIIGFNPDQFSWLQLINVDGKDAKVLLKLIPDFLKQKAFQDVKYLRKFLSTYSKSYKELFYINWVESRRLDNWPNLSPKTALKFKPYCHLTLPTCSKGQELVYSYYKEANWTRSFGFHCQKCAENFYKNIENNTKCLPCPAHFFSTQDRLSCYDPYTSIYLPFGESKEFWIYTILASMHGLFILLSFVTFHRNQHTPLVRASQKNISYAQMLTHILLTFVPLIVFTGQPSEAKCFARPFIIGILFSITTAINLGKIQKVLVIFNTDYIMTRKDVLVTKATEIFVIAFVVFLDAGSLLVRTLWGSKVQVVVVHNQNELTREYFCSNNLTVLIQYGFILLVIITNAIQGIRARKLPSHYRETIYVIYASFTSSIIIISSAGMYLALSSEHSRSVLLLMMGLALNIEHFMLIYVYKLYVMIFRKNINRASIYNRKRQMKVSNILAK